MPFSRSALTSAGCLFSQTIVRVHARHVCCVANNRSSNVGAVRWSLSCLIESMQYFSPATSFACVRLASTSASNAVRHVKHETIIKRFSFSSFVFRLALTIAQDVACCEQILSSFGQTFLLQLVAAGQTGKRAQRFQKTKRQEKGSWL